MASYLDAKGVKCSSLDPVRIGYAGDSSPPAILWVGVLPGSLAAEVGIEVVVHLEGILSARGINDVHVEPRESEVFRSTKLYKPVPASFATVRVIEPFSTAVDLPISTEATPSIGGTGGFFIFDPRHRGKHFLVTARHVVIRPDSDDNELVEYTNTGHPRKVLLFSDPAAEKHLTVIRPEISGKQIIIKQLENHLRLERPQEQSHRPCRSVSPQLVLNVGEDGLTEDWAVIEVDVSKIDSTNFIGNVVDLGIDILVDEFTSWISSHPASPPSFDYSGDRLHEFFGTIPAEEMWKTIPNTRDHKERPGHHGDEAWPRLRPHCRTPQHHTEVAVLPRNSKSGPFSKPSDSGLGVVDGKGRLAGLLTGAVNDISDCTYVTSANFIHARMLMRGLRADFFPSSAA
ncbi:hypothetical protein H4582DRAFT_2097061 [Lactarius indigo]|nr:hypothetical protein H4582DRAFT_2097061 [Lactarius indigo]